jgi:hypothetical protein
MSTPIILSQCPETREKWHFGHQAIMAGWRRQVIPHPEEPGEAFAKPGV